VGNDKSISLGKKAFGSKMMMLNRVCNSMKLMVLLILGTMLNSSPSLAIDWTPTFDDAEIERVIRLRIPTLGEIPPNYILEERSDVLYKLANQLFTQGNFDEACNCFHYVNKTFPVLDSQLREAVCLEKLGRVKEATSLFNSILKKRPDIDAYEHLAHFLIESKQYEEALKIADQSSVMNSERSALLKSEILEASGDIPGAQKAAQQAYYHCWHVGFDTKKAEQRLAALQLKPDPHPTINNSMTSTVLGYLHKFAAMKEPPSIEVVRKTLGLEMPRFHRGGTPDSKFFDYRSRIDCTRPMIEVIYGTETLQDTGYWLSILINEDLTSIEPATVKKEFGDSKFYPYTRSGCVHSPASMFYKKRRPSIEMTFASGGLNPLGTIDFKWLNTQTVSKKSKEVNTASSDASNSSEKEVLSEKQDEAVVIPDPLAVQAGNQLKQSDYAQAKRTIEKEWNGNVPGNASQRLEIMRQRRTLLIAAYRGLKEDDVADFLQQAPLNIISRAIRQNQFRPAKLLTGEEYSHKPWTLDGWTNSSTSGMYMFRWCGLAVCPVNSKSPRWSEYYKLFGSRAQSAPTPMAPPSGALLDMIDSDEFRVGL
jgi:hypothetical protein